MARTERLSAVMGSTRLAAALLPFWIVNSPQGGPFAVDIDPAVVARMDRA